MNLVEYTKAELERAYGQRIESDDPSDRWDNRMRDHVTEIVEMFSKQGHSGFSAATALEILKRVLNYKPLMPLTGEDDEWEEREPGLYQNNRCFTVFKSIKAGKVEYWDIDIVDEANKEQLISFPYWPA